MHYVFLPVYNEEKAIERVIQRLADTFSGLAEPLHILVVDDGSTDRSPQILEEIGAGNGLTVLRHDRNRGIDGAFRTGMEFLAGTAEQTDTLILLEADDTNDLESLPPMLDSLANGHDLVIASRFVPGGRVLGFPLWRRIPCRVVNGMLRLVFGLRNVTDYTIFFRGYSMGLLQQGLAAYGPSFIETVGFVANAEILLKLSAFNPQICEVPLVYAYDRKESTSKLRVPFTIRQYLKLIFRQAHRRRIRARP